MTGYVELGEPTAGGPGFGGFTDLSLGTSVAGDVRKKVNNFFYFVTYLLSYGRPVKHVKLLLRDIGQGTPATLTRQHSLFSRW